jgi:hypothetical protein
MEAKRALRGKSRSGVYRKEMFQDHQQFVTWACARWLSLNIWHQQMKESGNIDLCVANGTAAFNAKRHTGSHTLAGITPDKLSEHIFSERFSEEAR